ncbi:MAG TPA: hypothetical protein VFS63_11400 [Pseudolabrys sp.]|jgi:hypothetical protein|nr:hypothetical protein [Pseudolabrys sp.]HVU19589.1 hypothetical protein [Rhizomicrobium sp.]
MTTFPLRESTRNPFVDALARIASAIDAFFEVIEEAQALAREADKRYHFVEW